MSRVAPIAAIMSCTTLKISMSAFGLSEPKMSTLICQCSRVRPRWGRSYRWQLALQYRRTGNCRAPAFPAIMRATEGVISGRSAGRRPPRSVSV